MIRSFGRQSIVVWAFPLVIAKGTAEELMSFGQLYLLSGAAAKRRANELLETFDLACTAAIAVCS